MMTNFPARFICNFLKSCGYRKRAKAIMRDLNVKSFFGDKLFHLSC